jgi:hypothetical protein
LGQQNVSVDTLSVSLIVLIIRVHVSKI